MGKEFDVTTPVKVVIGILITIFIGLIVFIIYFYNEREEKERIKKGLNIEDVEKTDSMRDWIYDASYEYDVYEPSYEAEHGAVEVNNNVAPYVNMKSSSANKANEEILDLFNDKLKYFEENNTLKSPNYSFMDYTYEVYNEKYVSLLITITSGDSITNVYTYKSYMFNIKGGDNVSFEEISKELGLNNNKIKTLISKRLDEYYSQNENEENIDDNKTKSLNYYNDALINNELTFFIENGALNVVIEIYSSTTEDTSFEKIALD